jgi:hypothetical protein
MYPEGSDSIFANKFFVLLICVILSALTYSFVENRIRFRKEKIVVFGLLFLMTMVGLSCVYTISVNSYEAVPYLYDPLYDVYDL